MDMLIFFNSLGILHFQMRMGREVATEWDDEWMVDRARTEPKHYLHIFCVGYFPG